MWLFARTFEELRAEDLQSLVDNHVRESSTLEYKGEMYGTSDADIREMLRDVCSLANAEGGTIVIGVTEDGQGVPVSLKPMPDPAKHADRIVKSCLANISERIPGLRSGVVPVGMDGGVVVQIPRSYRRPHMVTFQGRTEFWVRHDKMKSPMSMAEIRTAITSTQELEMRAEQFLEARRREAKQRTLEPLFQLSGRPLLLEDGRVDTSMPQLTGVLTNPPRLRPGGVSLATQRDVVEPTLRGIRASGIGLLEVFRNGHVEFLLRGSTLIDNSDPERPLRAWAVAEYMRNFVHFLEHFRGVTMISDPYLVAVSLWKCGRVKMYERESGPFVRGSLGEWDEEDDLVLPPVISTLGEAPDGVVRRLANRFWNAFHFAGCPFFDNAGRFRLGES
jgi:hypothetical protein